MKNNLNYAPPYCYPINSWSHKWVGKLRFGCNTITGKAICTVKDAYFIYFFKSEPNIAHLMQVKEIQFPNMELLVLDDNTLTLTKKIPWNIWLKVTFPTPRNYIELLRILTCPYCRGNGIYAQIVILKSPFMQLENCQLVAPNKRIFPVIHIQVYMDTEQGKKKSPNPAIKEIILPDADNSAVHKVYYLLLFLYSSACKC